LIGTPGATIDSSFEKNGWIGCAQDKGWFDGRVGQIWIEKVLKPYVRDAEKAFLLIDHCKVHLTSEFVQSVNDLGVDVDYIPAGYTCVLQPVDVGVNEISRKQFATFITNGALRNIPKLQTMTNFRHRSATTFTIGSFGRSMKLHQTPFEKPLLTLDWLKRILTWMTMTATAF
jgi:hypothetical protein